MSQPNKTPNEYISRKTMMVEIERLTGEIRAYRFLSIGLTALCGGLMVANVLI
jgi:hypothetical protein